MSKLNLDNLIQQIIDSVFAPKSPTAKGNSKTIITPTIVFNLCKEIIPIFEQEKTVMELTAPISIAGDVHGQLIDLVFALRTGGMPPNNKWLFLGDYVDRGPCSLEVISLLFALKIKYPNSVFLIRGNHEAADMTEHFGFLLECINKLDSNSSNPDLNYANDSVGTRSWRTFCGAFEYIPIAAIVSKDYLCVHGGISPLLEKVDQIRNFKRPLMIPPTGLLTDLLWSDPSKDINNYGDSERGMTYTFGLLPVKKFLKENKLKYLIRGHQVAMNGCDFPFLPEKCVITVFTASNYAEGINNKAAILLIDQAGKFEVKQLSIPSDLGDTNNKPAPLPECEQKQSMQHGLTVKVRNIRTAGTNDKKRRSLSYSPTSPPNKNRNAPPLIFGTPIPSSGSQPPQQKPAAPPSPSTPTPPPSPSETPEKPQGNKNKNTGMPPKMPPHKTTTKIGGKKTENNMKLQGSNSTSSLVLENPQARTRRMTLTVNHGRPGSMNSPLTPNFNQKQSKEASDSFDYLKNEPKNPTVAREDGGMVGSNCFVINPKPRVRKTTNQAPRQSNSMEALCQVDADVPAQSVQSQELKKPEVPRNRRKTVGPNIVHTLPKNQISNAKSGELQNKAKQ